MPPNHLEPDRASRPRDRLLALGSQTLSDTELLAVLFGGASALDLSRSLLDRVCGLGGLVGRTAAELVAEPGIGPARSSTLLATLELASRMARQAIEEGELLERPEAVARYLALRYGTRDQEVMGSLYVDRRKRLLCEAMLYRGTLNRVVAEPRAILKRGLLVGASGIVLFHTHPSGDPTPSPEDLEFTRRIAKAGDVVGMPLLDHLILGGPNAWVSLRAQGAW